MGKYGIEVLSCNKSDVIVTGPGVILPLFFIAVILVHGVIMEPCGCQGVTMALMLWAVI